MVQFSPIGDKCILASLGNEISLDANKKVRKYLMALEQAKITGISEYVPTYCGINIYYDPVKISYHNLLFRLSELEDNYLEAELPDSYVIEIPTCYEECFGLDLQYVADYNGLALKEVIEIHSKSEYLIYMLGFTPGFCYLGGLSEKIATPRLTEPRNVISAGSVGIADNQTGIYPLDSPGGWRIIGKTPIQLYNPHRKECPILLKAGDYIKFVPISIDEYEFLLSAVSANKYQVKKYLKRD